MARINECFLLFLIKFILLNGALSKSTRLFKDSVLTFDSDDHLILNLNESSVSFFALGDWGGGGLFSYTSAQKTVADQMAKMSSVYDTRFQIGLGDNFYFYGVKNENDSKFKKTFEEVYRSSHLKQTPWFHTLGNHDYYGNVQAQIDYTSKSKRWILPNFNYSVDIMTNYGQKKLISLFMIDTIKLCGNTPFTLNPFIKIDSHTPLYASINDENLADEYFAELDHRLNETSSSGVSYIIVAGHFPVYSVAEHGSTECLIDKLAPLLYKYRVSAYLSGHDHNLQHISVTDSNTTVEYMVSGANSLNNNSLDNFDTVPEKSLKFRWPDSPELIYGAFLLFQANENNLTVNFVKANGKFLYQTVIKAR